METWVWLLGLLLSLNLKNLPLLWHFRFFRAVVAGLLVHRQTRHLFNPGHIFSPTISTTRTPLTEGDFNLHKSNSTYFTDLDISRAYLAGVLFGPLFVTGVDGQRCNMIVGSVACTFRKEVKLYSPVEAWSRVASWDDKWIYMVTHFVSGRRSTSRPGVLLAEAAKHSGQERTSVQSDQRTTKKVVLASAVTQLVFKQGRKTVRPVHALIACGLLRQPEQQDDDKASGCEHNKPSSPKKGALGFGIDIPTDFEAMRRDNLPIVQLEKGWDKVTELFQETDVILGRHNCF